MIRTATVSGMSPSWPHAFPERPRRGAGSRSSSGSWWAVDSVPDPQGRGPSDSDRCGSDVLIHSEQVRRIVFRLDPGQAVVVVSERRLHALLPLVHHEVHVRATGRIRVQGIEIALAPLGDGSALARVGIDTNDDLGPV